MSWKLTWNLILVPYWILESFVENRTIIFLCNIASIGVFSGSDGCRPDLHYSWKPSPYVDNLPMNIVSKIHRKPSYGLCFIAIWSWRLIHVFCPNFSSVQCSVRALAWVGASARDRVCYLCNLQYALRALVNNGASARKSLVQTSSGACERSLATCERSHQSRIMGLARVLSFKSWFFSSLSRIPTTQHDQKPPYTSPHSWESPSSSKLLIWSCVLHRITC